MKITGRQLACLCLVMLLIILGIEVRHLLAAQIQDDRGRSVSLEQPPRRVISLYGGLTEILVALGAGSQVVARTQGDDCLKDIPTVGTHLQPNVEMILALKPDLVIQGGVPKAMPALRKLEAEGIPVAMFAPRDFNALFKVIKQLGALTNRTAAADELTRCHGGETGGGGGPGGRKAATPGLFRGALPQPAGRRPGLPGE